MSKKQATLSVPMTTKQANQIAQPIQTHKSSDPTAKSPTQHLTAEEHTQINSKNNQKIQKKITLSQRRRDD